MTRQPIIAGNWKMNKTLAEAEAFIDVVIDQLSPELTNEAVVGAPALFLPSLVEKAKDTPIKIAAQNCYFEDAGAYTGEISPHALGELGVDYVIIGHSERRQLFHETDELINKKAQAIFKNGMRPIICCGEMLAEREAGQTNERVTSQVAAALAGLTAEQVAQTVIAYEPIWAIGTGQTATTAEAQATIHVLREKVSRLYDEETARSVRIQYGGSVKPDNIAELLAQPDIDGALVGGASLEPKSFLELIEVKHVE